jgi:hypothetical protein
MEEAKYLTVGHLIERLKKLNLSSPVLLDDSQGEPGQFVRARCSMRILAVPVEGVPNLMQDSCAGELAIVLSYDNPDHILRTRQ